MKPIQLLSEAIIETLKVFSYTKSPLTADSLSAALCCREEICSLLKDAPEIIKDEQAHGPSNKIAHVPLKIPGPVQQPDLSRTLRPVSDTFNMILATIEQIAQGENLQRSSELRLRLDDCHTMESLTLESGEIVNTVNSVVNRAVEQIDFANELLAGLTENLSAMEKQLFSYQGHSRETYILQDQFCNNLLSQTREIDQAVIVSTALEEARSIIASRLSIIGKAIEVKRREDETRLKEADSKIAELQMSVHNYNEEINKMTHRANELEKEALLDPLLNINNRRAYDLKILESMRNYHRTGQFFGVILIDVDHFKNINDQFGHQAGDRCLQELTKLVESCVRKTDFLARYGGDELVVIVPGCTAEQTRKIAEKIRDCIDRTRFYYQEQVIRFTISIGVTEAQPGDSDAGNLFVRVDEAMYQAKKGGRNQMFVM
ncbi:MAG: diguanylate cyclase [Syntrophobacteraceae bacterium]